jgi:protein gp37
MTGCTKISAGCKNCYAERLSYRLQAMGNEKYINGFKFTTHPDIIFHPLKWKKPQMIFVNSMSDIFHESAPIDFIKTVFNVMAKAHWHIFQVLTKRSDQLLKSAELFKWEPNIWMGVTIESAEYLYRADHIRRTPAKIKFLSIEPLLCPIPALNLEGINWVILGGESGPGARVMKKSWVRSIKDQCETANVPFFFKQGEEQTKRNLGDSLMANYKEIFHILKYLKKDYIQFNHVAIANYCEIFREIQITYQSMQYTFT